MTSHSLAAALTTLCAAAVVASSPSVAGACSLPVPEQHQIDWAERAVDTTAPAAPTVEVEGVERGFGPLFGASTGCDTVGSVVLRLATTDDRTGPGRMGYEVRVSRGHAPEGLYPLDQPVRASGGRLYLRWSDKGTAWQRLDFSLSVTAIDLAGNRSPPVEANVVHWGGYGPAAAGALVVALSIAGVVLARKRRR